jgi:hypothetical protein
MKNLGLALVATAFIDHAKHHLPEPIQHAYLQGAVLL